jgi:hypothetical protein
MLRYQITQIFCCSKCLEITRRALNLEAPIPTECPNGDNHDWTALGQSGAMMCKCTNCGVTVQTEGLPASTKCPNGHWLQGGNHNWQRLRPDGTARPDK